MSANPRRESRRENRVQVGCVEKKDQGAEIKSFEITEKREAQSSVRDGDHWRSDEGMRGWRIYTEAAVRAGEGSAILSGCHGDARRWPIREGGADQLYGQQRNTGLRVDGLHLLNKKNCK